MKLSRVSILENRRENLKLNVVLVVILFLDSKALYYLAWTLVMCKRYTVIYGYSWREMSFLQWENAECMTYNRTLSAIPPVTMAKANSHLKKKKWTLLGVRREEQEEVFICLSWSHLLVMVVITIKIVQVKTELKSAKQGWFTLL